LEFCEVARERERERERESEKRPGADELLSARWKIDWLSRKNASRDAKREEAAAAEATRGQTRRINIAAADKYGCPSIRLNEPQPRAARLQIFMDCA
jgi:hypothetical protein